MRPKKAKGGKPKEKAKRPESQDEMPGLGSMERTMSELTRMLQGQGVEAPGTGKDSPRRAQELIYDAWEKPRKQDRIRLAEKALEMWPDCADAYSLLAEEKSQSVTEARIYLEKGVQAGERALGPAVFAEDVGHFWGILETRPYMRARAGLAECLWRLGEEDEALAHYQDMLRLNPNDNQGIRDLVLTRLLKRGEQEKAGKLLEAYSDDGSANWLYNRALWLFREQGESAEANGALGEALEQNGHVPAYLLGKKKVPKQLPDYIGWGDESEAFVYAADAEPIWRATEGARGWLLRSSQRRK
jgi:tetratricopeptide (TPR) repeat protein